MRPSPAFQPNRSRLVPALVALALGCSREAPRGAPPSPQRPPGVSAARASADRAPPRADLVRLAALVAALPAHTTLEPHGAEAGAAPVPFSPRLTGRGPDGEAVLEFPLVHTRVAAQITGDVARVEVTQFYANPSPDRLEAIYAFPLPPDAAVTDMLFRIGDRVVISEVRRREEARRTYEAAKREGRTAALTEQERPNLFTQSVANVPPGETVAVVLRYVHEVPFDGGRYAFHFPTTVGPRYVPGAALAPDAPGGARGPGTSPDTGRVPDASRVTPPVSPPGTRSGHDVDLLVRLVPGGAFDEVETRSHRVVTGLEPAGARLVALAEDDRIPNKDFVLTWRPAGVVPGAHALVQREKGEDFLMLFVQPPAGVAPALVRPKELVFLVDKSGSMMGAPFDRVRALVARALDAMGPDDTFQVVAFDGSAQAMSEAPLPATPSAIARAKEWLASLEGGGGTEMLEGVRAALSPPEDPRRLRMVVFCTDGFIGNEPEIIEAVEALRGRARVFGFGIGSSVNRYLVEGVGRAGRGASEVVSLDEPPDAAVARLFARIDRPLLTDLEVGFEGAEVTDLLPARLPDLFAGQPLVVAARVRGGRPSHVILRGRLGEAPWVSRVEVATARAAVGDGSEQPVVGTLWARRRIDDLLGARPTAPERSAIEETVALALRFKLVTPYTSFVAVERELRVDPALPLAQALVPNELPEGVSYEGIFGPASLVDVAPARVKPGDPELRVVAPPGAVSVSVALPFERSAREAIRDPARGDFVLRFLVPPAWPDGSYDARVTIRHEDGRREERVAPIRVDTTPAAVAVLAAPATAAPGETVRLALKPALPVAWLPELARRPGGLGNAVKGAMEVKEVLVRAPWGERARARMEGPLGAWVAELHVPVAARAGAAGLEVVASDAAGNVSRRRLTLAVVPARAPGTAGALRADVGARLVVLALAGAALAAAFLRLGAERRGRRRATLLALALAPAVGHARPASLAVSPPRPGRRGRVALARAMLVAVLGGATLLAAATAALAWKERARLRHLALPAVSDPSLAPEPLAALAALPPCASAELARVGRRVTAVLAASDGATLVGTFDGGIVRLGTDGAAQEIAGLEGRERFVNALAEHDGLVWAATQGGLVALDGERRALTLLAGEGVTSLARAGQRLYAGTARGVFRVSAGRGAEPMSVTGPDGEPIRASALAASETELWIGTASGAYALSRASLEAPLLSRIATWHPLVFGAPGAATNVVTALAPLGAGALAGTDDGGLVRLGADGAVSALRLADARANEVNPGAAAVAGEAVVVGTQGGGLVFARPTETGLGAGRPLGLERLAVSALSASGGELLAGTAQGAVLRIACGAEREPGNVEEVEPGT
ncbi:Vault protein inter-alpha-trypsin domain protein [Anaeromyxobacter sp. Fw109-5]|nr:Vault protein inter-alpha-trypsin domain protein [Anaeromyxobacter sp. Fw109-5]